MGVAVLHFPQQKGRLLGHVGMSRCADQPREALLIEPTMSHREIRGQCPGFESTAEAPCPGIGPGELAQTIHQPAFPCRQVLASRRDFPEQSHDGTHVDLAEGAWNGFHAKKIPRVPVMTTWFSHGLSVARMFGAPARSASVPATRQCMATAAIAYKESFGLDAPLHLCGFRGERRVGVCGCQYPEVRDEIHPPGLRNRNGQPPIGRDACRTVGRQCSLAS